MNKQLELAKNKTLDTMSEVMTTEELKILANVMDREFERLSRTQRHSCKKSNGNSSRIVL